MVRGPACPGNAERRGTCDPIVAREVGGRTSGTFLRLSQRRLSSAELDHGATDISRRCFESVECDRTLDSCSVAVPFKVSCYPVAFLKGTIPCPSRAVRFSVPQLLHR